jgi:uncharacterized RDD family membrane protein YckC
MRCPKCHYISFGSADRCRNCGYDFSLVEDAPSAELPIHDPDAPVGPLADLPLTRIETAPAPPPPPEPASTPAPEAPPPPRASAPSKLDLPLFTGDPADDTPLVSASAVPRPPLSVRRAGPALARTRVEPAPDEEGRLDLQSSPKTGDRPDRHHGAARVDAQRDAAAPETGRTASLGARAAGGLIDLLILVAIDAAVLYLTLRVLELAPNQAALLPPVPLVAFLLLLNGGYLAIFTAAGGQTIGKMLMGTRVVPFHDGGPYGGRVALGAAIVRAAAYFGSLLPAGLGFLPILLTADRRALHDRLADTRVVQA